MRKQPFNFIQFSIKSIIIIRREMDQERAFLTAKDLENKILQNGITGEKFEKVE